MVAAKESPPEIYGRMAAVLAKMPAVGKDQRNQSQGFAYQGLADIVAALNPVLSAEKIFCVPEVLERIPEVRATAKGGTLWTVHLLVRFTFFAPDGSSVSSITWGEGSDAGDKSTSKAMTMAFKSMLRQVFAISESDDVDPDSGGEPSHAPPAFEPMSESFRAEIQRKMDGLDVGQSERLRELWIGEKGNLPSFKNAGAAHVPQILALIQVASIHRSDEDEAPGVGASPANVRPEAPSEGERAAGGGGPRDLSPAADPLMCLHPDVFDDDGVEVCTLCGERML